MDFKDMWNKAAAEPPKQFSDLPEGTYKGRVLKCAFEPAKDPAKTNLVWDIQVIEGPQKNCHAWIYRNFSKTDTGEQNQKAIGRALNDLISLGLPCKAEETKASMEGVVGKVIEFRYKPDGKVDADGRPGMWKNLLRIVDEPAPPPPRVPDSCPDDDLPY